MSEESRESQEFARWREDCLRRSRQEAERGFVELMEPWEPWDSDWRDEEKPLVVEEED